MRKLIFYFIFVLIGLIPFIATAGVGGIYTTPDNDWRIYVQTFPSGSAKVIFTADGINYYAFFEGNYLDGISNLGDMSGEQRYILFMTFLDENTANATVIYPDSTSDSYQLGKFYQSPDPQSTIDGLYTNSESTLKFWVQTMDVGSVLVWYSKDSISWFGFLDAVWRDGVDVYDLGSQGYHLQMTFAQNGEATAALTPPGGAKLTYELKQDRRNYSNKAIIVAGGGSGPENLIWGATRSLTRFVYQTLIAQGFERENIYLLSDDTPQDIDGNGIADELLVSPTKAKLEQTISQWATDANDVVLFLADHGGDRTFRINTTEILQAAELDTWLDELQSHISGKLIVVYEACESGSFIPLLLPETGKQRIVVTSASANQSAQFVEGSISFSDFFWKQIFSGATIGGAFDLAKSTLPHSYATLNQVPQMDANGNGVSNEQSDFQVANTSFIGIRNLRLADLPYIESVSTDQLLNGETTAGIWAEDLTSSNPIVKVWAVILPPDHYVGDPSVPITDLPTIDLNLVSGNRYEAAYTDFSHIGSYEVTIYAQDENGYTSLPKSFSVTQTIQNSAYPSDGIWKDEANSMALYFQKYLTGSCVVVVSFEGKLIPFLDEHFDDGIEVLNDLLNRGYSMQFDYTSQRDATITIKSPTTTNTFPITLNFPALPGSSDYMIENGIWKTPNNELSLFIQKYEAGSCIIVTLASEELNAFLDTDYQDGISVITDIYGMPYSISIGLTNSALVNLSVSLPELSGKYSASLVFADDM